ncbi:hypothetical protein [Caldifermentibacillus hisashii]|nr:hypothetical protein [Caldifermentibacillus hisashii]
MAETGKKQNTIFKKVSLFFTIFCIAYLFLKFTGLLTPVLEFFKR